MLLISANDDSVAVVPTAQQLTSCLEGDYITRKQKLEAICILTFLSRYPVSENYFKKYASESRRHWSSIFQVNNTWNHLKFTRFFQELEDLSLGSWITHHAEVFFQFRANAQEFRYSTFTPAQQRYSVIQAIRLLSNYIRSIPQASWTATTNIRLVGHVDVCLDVEANLFGDTELGIMKDREALTWLAQFYQEMGRCRDAEALYHLMLGMDYNLEYDPDIQRLLESLGVLLDLQGRHG